jgi:hypothetical protein
MSIVSGNNQSGIPAGILAQPLVVRMVCVNGQLKGIDTFYWAFTHEMQHHKDWEDFWQIDTNGISLWQAAFHQPGPNGNTDGDNFPNSFEDPNGSGIYDSGDPYDLTTEFTAGNIAGIADQEDRNCKLHKAVKGEHAKDWADPGMQHRTLDRYDD